MAKPPMPTNVRVPAQIPEPYPQVEKTSPATTATFGFDPVPPSKGNLGFDSLPKPRTFFQEPSTYTPLKVTRRR